jgi:hypothetical protein
MAFRLLTRTISDAPVARSIKDVEERRSKQPSLPVAAGPRTSGQRRPRVTESPDMVRVPSPSLKEQAYTEVAT